MRSATGRLTGVTGVLLAGGRSARMGVDKRLLEVGGRTLFARALGVLDEVFEQVLVSFADANTEVSAAGHRVVYDLLPNCATLGGLYSALTVAETEWIFAIACDMPLVERTVVDYLVSRCHGSDYVVPVLSTGPQPMHACYRKTCLTPLKRMAEAGELRLQGLIEDQALHGIQVSEAELTPLDPHLRSFINVNTPADLEMVRKLLAQPSR